MKKLIEGLIEKWKRQELYHKGRHDGATALVNDPLVGASYQCVSYVEEGWMKAAEEIIDDLENLSKEVK